MVGLRLVRILEGVRDPIVKVLHVLIVLLLEVLEADAYGICSIFWGVSLQEFLLEVIPVILVEADDVVQRVVP